MVAHRWRFPEGVEPPAVGEVIVGAIRAWRVTEVRPIESAIHPNDFRGTMTAIPWQPGDPFDRVYPNGRQRAFHGTWCPSSCTHPERTRKEPPL